MTARSHSSEPGPVEPLSAPEGASDPQVGTERHPRGQFGPQVGAQSAEAALARVRNLAEVWQDAPDPLARAMAADLTRTIHGPERPPAHDGGPTVQEAANDDKRWPLEKAGE